MGVGGWAWPISSVILLSTCAGLSHLVGTNLLRAYMHGYFMDVRLYHKVSESINGRVT